MAPTVCVAEFPIVGTTVNTYVRRRRRSQNRINITKRQTFPLEQILQNGTIIETSLTSRENCLRKLKYMNMIPNCSIPDKNTKHATNTNEYCKKLLMPKKEKSFAPYYAWQRFVRN
ncbi:hypothetical protein CAJAP_01914 [Camponotus japonicus]